MKTYKITTNSFTKNLLYASDMRQERKARKRERHLRRLKAEMSRRMAKASVKSGK